MIKKLLRRYFIAGLLFWLPIWATYVVVKFLITLMEGTLTLLPKKYQPDQLLGFHFPGLGLLFTIIILFITGLLVSNFIGHRLMQFWNMLVSRIPLIRSIHAAVKQVAEALLHPSGTSFKKVLLIEYPRRGVWSVGFLTSEHLLDTPTDCPMITAFIPTTPNPTSGFLLVIPKTDVTELNISVEEALRLIISVGVVTPDRMTADIPFGASGSASQNNFSNKE